MTEKIVITQEQADAIALFKQAGTVPELEYFRSAREYFIGGYESLKTFTLDEFARILYEPNSYEVRLEYKLGDWVINKVGNIGRIDAIHAGRFKGVWMSKADGGIKVLVMDCLEGMFVRHATPEEVKAEQERLKWMEIEEGDVLQGLRSGALAIFIREYPHHQEVQVRVHDGMLQTWDKASAELYAKKVGATND